MRRWLVCLALALLTGCSQLQPGAEGSGLGPPLAQLTAEGRISLRQGEQLSHLRFRWEHTPQTDVVLLMSPLGQGLAELARDATGARLKQPNRSTVMADNLAQLTEAVLGIGVPLDAMADWLRGEQPALSGEIDGWRVLVRETAPFRQSRLLRIIEARRDAIEFKLVIDQWDAPE